MSDTMQSRRPNTLAVLEYLAKHPEHLEDVERELNRLHSEEDRRLRGARAAGHRRKAA